MPLWDAVAMGLAGTGTNPEFNGVPLINNSYNCYVGSVLAFYIGEGRVTAIYGGETKLVFDWESVLVKLLDWGGQGPLGSLAKTRRLMGGGDTTLVIGPTNKLNYYGSDLAVGRARDDFKMTWPLMSEAVGNQGEAGYVAPKDISKTGAIPVVIRLLLALGFIGILAAALLLRYWWGFYGISSSKPQTEQEQLASVLIPMFEGLWLSLLYAVETIAGGVWGVEKSWENDLGNHPHEASLLMLNSNKARTELGWSDKLSFEESVKWTIDWYKNVHNGNDPLEETLKNIKSFEAK